MEGLLQKYDEERAKSRLSSLAKMEQNSHATPVPHRTCSRPPFTAIAKQLARGAELILQS